MEYHVIHVYTLPTFRSSQCIHNVELAADTYMYNNNIIVTEYIVYAYYILLTTTTTATTTTSPTAS